jgi:hypothetical protein
MFYLTASQESGPEQRTHTVGAVWGTEPDQFLFFWRILSALWRPKKKKKTKTKKPVRIVQRLFFFLFLFFFLVGNKCKSRHIFQAGK